MRLTSVLLAIFLFGVGSASAQTLSGGAMLVTTPLPTLTRAAANPVFSADLPEAMLASMRPAPAPAPQEIEGVFPGYSWQVSVGFTYMRFYEVPGSIVSTSGFNGSMAYSVKPWAAVEGVIDAGVGTQLGQTAQSVFTGGGLRFSAAQSDALTLWIHGDAGEAHFSPKTSFGGEDAFGYEAGAGVDVSPRHHRIGYRLGVDMVGTSFFGTYQISPKVSAGIVFKF